MKEIGHILTNDRIHSKDICRTCTIYHNSTAKVPSFFKALPLGSWRRRIWQSPCPLLIFNCLFFQFLSNQCLSSFIACDYARIWVNKRLHSVTCVARNSSGIFCHELVAMSSIKAWKNFPSTSNCYPF